MKQVTITWKRGGTDTYPATKVITELVQWRLEQANGDIMLIPIRNVEKILIEHGES